MNRRQIFYSIPVALALTLLGIFFFDQPIAAFAQRAEGRQSQLLLQGTHCLEVASGYPINKYFLAWLALGAGALLFVWKSTRPAAWMLVFIGVAHIVIRVTAGTLKNVFTPAAPIRGDSGGKLGLELLRRPRKRISVWPFRTFLGPLFPLAFLFPRYRWPLLIIPLFISVARVGVNDHWASDVIASAAIAALLTFAFIWIFRMKPAQNSPETTAAIIDKSAHEPV